MGACIGRVYELGRTRQEVVGEVLGEEGEGEGWFREIERWREGGRRMNVEYMEGIYVRE